MDNNSNDNNKMKMPKFNMNWIYAIIIVTLGALYFTSGDVSGSASADAGYSDFKTFVIIRWTN